jgi:hypothetical protein
MPPQTQDGRAMRTAVQGVFQRLLISLFFGANYTRLPLNHGIAGFTELIFVSNQFGEIFPRPARSGRDLLWTGKSADRILFPSFPIKFQPGREHPQHLANGSSKLSYTSSAVFFYYGQSRPAPVLEMIALSRQRPESQCCVADEAYTTSGKGLPYRKNLETLLIQDSW